jgi:uncharacterized protein YukE
VADVWHRDPVQIEALAGEFDGTSRVVQSLSADLYSYGSALGAPALVGAFGDVAKQWESTRNELTDLLTNAGDLLRSVATNFVNTEKTISAFVAE